MRLASSVKGGTAIVFAAHPWRGVPYGLHHMARALARLGWQVLYVEPYFSPLHLASGRRRGRVLGRRFRTTDEAGVAVLSPFTVVPHVHLPLLRSPLTLHLARRFSWPRLGAGAFAKTIFAKPDLVLCGSPTMAEVALSLDAGLKIYRLADDSSLFDVLTPATRQAEIDAVPQFDGLIVTSDLLLAQAERLGARQAILVSNGVDRAFFEAAALTPPELAPVPVPRVLYAGAVENWFDWQLLLDAALARPGYSYLLLGRIGTPPPGPLPANVFLLGQHPYGKMPGFMQASDVGIIPFASGRRGEAVRAINPLKLYEYLAAGLPVVSSIHPPDLQCDGLFFYSGPTDFLRNLDKAIERRRSRTRIAPPDHVDWMKIVGTMLDRFGLPGSRPLS